MSALRRAIGAATGRVLVALADAPPWGVLAAAWLVLFIYAYPGQMTTDSFDHLAEARSGMFTDSHPPTMSLLWRLVEHVVAGGVGMLIVQSTAFLLGLYAVLRRTFAPRGAAWAAALLFVFPPVFLPFAVIWKDCVMAGLLMLGIAGISAARRPVKLAGLAALALATAVRYNAFAATFPLVVLLFELRPGLPWLQRYAIATAAWLAVALSAFGLNAAITDRQMHLWHSSLALFDIVGTLSRLDRDLPDAHLEQTFAGTGLVVHDRIHTRARAAFNPRDFLPIITDEQRRLWDVPAYGVEQVPEPRRDAIARAWRDIVTTYPGAYVRYRLDVMGEVLCLWHARPAGVVPRRDFKVIEFAWAQAVPTSVSPVQHRLTYWMSSLWKVAPIFVPWMYALLALIVGGIGIARRERDVIALCASGLATEATLALLAVSPDYRYSHWLIVSTCLAIVIAVARRARTPARAIDDKRVAAMRTQGSWRFRRAPPLAILAVGWLGMMLYANPGYLSYDSVHALAGARAGTYHDLAAVLWRVVDFILPGPFGMLVVQTTCFLAGAYLVLRRCVSPRSAAVGAIVVLWFPAISGTLGVIWTESHAAGWLMLGAGLVCSSRRGVRLAGLGALALGAAMVPAGVVVIAPLVVAMFAWHPAQRRGPRLAVATAAWLVTAALAALLASRFADPRATDRARLDIAGTLHHGGAASDAALRPAFASPPAGDLAAAARAAYDPTRTLGETRAAVARTFGAADAGATMRARDAIVSASRASYLAYRWDVFRQLIQLTHRPADSQAYVWFTDVQDLAGSGSMLEHSAAPSGLQRLLQPAMRWLGTTWLFRPYVYLLLAVALAPLWLRTRQAAALIASGIAAELALLFAGHDPAVRASLWLAVTTLLGVIVLIARRASQARRNSANELV